MGTSDTLPDLDVAPATFETAQQEYLVAEKTDRDAAGNIRTPYPASSIVSRFTAGWANRVDDTLRAIQRRFRGEVLIGTHDTPADDPQASINWTAAASQVYLRNAANSAFRTLRLLRLQLGGGAQILDRSGSPEGAEVAGRGSVCLDLSTGDIYAKTTASGNTGWVRVGAGLVTQSDVTDVDVSNSTTETTLASFTLPADTLDADGRRATLRIRGDIFNNGASRAATYRVYAGGSIIWQDDITHGNVSIRRPMHLDLELTRRSASTQTMHGTISFGSSNSGAPDVGEGTMLGSSNLGFHVLNDGLTLDETGTIVFSASVEHAAATANMRTRVQTAHLEVA